MKKSVLKTAIFMELVAAMGLSICVVYGCTSPKTYNRQVAVEDKTSETVISAPIRIETGMDDLTEQEGYAEFYFDNGEVIEKDFTACSNEYGEITISFSGEDLGWKLSKPHATNA